MEATKALTGVGSGHLGMGIPSPVAVGSGARKIFYSVLRNVELLCILDSEAAGR